MSNEMRHHTHAALKGWQPVLFAAMAGGMAWGIRGQYGHETGAMIAGLLMSLTLVCLLHPRPGSLQAVRAVALGTVAMGFGGTMTYGQTVGLTHDTVLVGNWAALRWWMLGLAIKGGIWIGFAGVFLGMGLGGVRYRSRDMLVLMLAMVGAAVLGAYLLNLPFDPSNKRLPMLYFSDHWFWEPGELKPRRELWGGLLFALVTAAVYAGWFRRDRLARNMALWGFLGGALGFPAGQTLQAYHAWNPEFFQTGLWALVGSHINWWNMMETTFGTVMGAVLGLGLWLNRAKIQAAEDAEHTYLPASIEGILLALHLPLLILVEFAAIPAVDLFYDIGIIMGIIPMVAIVGGRWWPYLQIFPITLLPIAGKTLRQLVYHEQAIGPVGGWALYLVVPMSIAVLFAIGAVRKRAGGELGNAFLRYALLCCTWLYFLLNYAFFHFPWPWAQWTGRTPNGIIFTVYALGLTAMVLMAGRRDMDSAQEPVQSK